MQLLFDLSSATRRVIFTCLWEAELNAITESIERANQHSIKSDNGPMTMILGDLNSNAIWDKADRWWSHSGVVAELAEIGLHSLYHRVSNEAQGAETTPTFYLQRNLSKPYHIDYAFVSDDLVGGSEIEVGKSPDWLYVSDHMPLSVIVR